MKNVTEKLKKFLNQDITHTIFKYKIPLTLGLMVVILSCVGFFISYAYYQVDISTPIIGSTIDKIADIDVRIMAEERDANGSGLGSYSLYPYIPKAGYNYNSSKSYCTNSSSINYDANNYRVDISATGHDVCYLYFDSSANLDLTLYVYAENIDNNGIGNGTYTKLETTALPSTGYKLHVGDETDEHRSYCENGSTLSYNEDMFTIEANGKDTCYAYMDAVDVDIYLTLKVQSKAGSTNYYDTKTIPTSEIYTLNTDRSSCTGTSTLSLENQKVIINATSRTSCIAYLDVGSGVALSTLDLYSNEADTLSVSVEDSNLSSEAKTYYYSVDGGKTYASSDSNNYTFTGVDANTPVQAYSEDAYGNTSAIISSDNQKYVLNEVFPYKNQVQTLTITKAGYYYIQAWGAQGGYRTDSSKGGKGGYASGYVYLNENDNLFIHTGGSGGSGVNGCGQTICEGGYNGGGYRYKYYGGGGASDVRLGKDDLLARILVAAGGGSDGGIEEAGMYGGGLTGGSSTSGQSAVPEYGGKGGATSYSGYSKDFTIEAKTTTGLNSNVLENYAGGFGFGGAGTNISEGFGGAGGGGWYGGSGNIPLNSDDARGGGGGSSFVLTESSSNNLPEGYLVPNTYYMQKSLIVAGNSSFETVTGMSETGHEGNGTVKITYIGEELQ